MHIQDLWNPKSPCDAKWKTDVNYFFLLVIPTDEYLHAVRALAIPQCYALTPPLFFLFNHYPTETPHPPPTPAWVMACVDSLSLWEVVLHGLPLSSCLHACPFNQLGNPSWYLYRPWFSWYRCSPPSSLLYFLPCNLSLTSTPSPLGLSVHNDVFLLASVTTFQFILPSHFPPNPPPKQ